MTAKAKTSILMSDKTPLAISILIAAIGWSISHFVDRIENSPTIEYNLVVEKIDVNKTKLTVELHNLSLNKSFESSTFLIRRLDPADDSFRFLQNQQAIVIPHAPAWVGQELTATTSPEAAQFQIKLFPPEGQVDLVAYCTGSCERVVFQGRPAEGTVMRLVERNFETFLVRHELLLFVSLLGVMIVMLVALFL